MNPRVISAIFLVSVLSNFLYPESIFKRDPKSIFNDYKVTNSTEGQRLYAERDAMISKVKDLAGQVEQINSELGKIPQQIEDIEQEKEQLVAEMEQSIAELKMGYYCSKCGRTPIQIKNDSGETFQKHLNKVKGTALRSGPASEQQIKHMVADYERQINGLNGKIEQIRNTGQNLKDRKTKSIGQAHSNYWSFRQSMDDEMNALKKQNEKEEQELRNQIADYNRLIKKLEKESVDADPERLREINKQKLFLIASSTSAAFKLDDWGLKRRSKLDRLSVSQNAQRVEMDREMRWVPGGFTVGPKEFEISHGKVGFKFSSDYNKMETKYYIEHMGVQKGVRTEYFNTPYTRTMTQGIYTESAYGKNMPAGVKDPFESSVNIVRTTDNTPTYLRKRLTFDTESSKFIESEVNEAYPEIQSSIVVPPKNEE